MNGSSLENIPFSSEKQRARTAQLHAELEILKHVDQLQAHIDSSLNLVYFTGIIGENNEVYISMGTDEGISMSQIGLFQEKLLLKHNAKRLTVAFMEGDSTTVYFSFTPGFLPPNEVATRKELMDQQNNQIIEEMDEFEGEI